MHSKHDQALDTRYVQRHFWTLDGLIDAVASTREDVQDAIAAECVPGPIYVDTACGWWSALDRRERVQPEGEKWYSKGAAWPLRRAMLIRREGGDPTEAAAILQAEFIDEFEDILARDEGAPLAFAQCFDEGGLDAGAARRAAAREWRSWIEGGYGVCLRVFNARNCVEKETLGASLKAALAGGSHDTAKLLSQAARLSDVMLPFAPWQRATGTPGRTIDQLLSDLQLGHELPYGALDRLG